MQVKQCRKCGKSKPLEEFHRHAKSPDGRRHVCIACTGVASRETKTCNVCKVVKPLDEFSRSNNSPDGHQYTCKPCQSARSMSNAARHPDRHRATMRRYMETERYRETRKAYRDREREAIRENRKGWYYRNREEILARRRAREAADPEARARNNERSRAWQNAHRRERFYYHVAYEYGLSPEQYDAMLINQRGRCAICRNQGDLAVDHEHRAAGDVRGLLCGSCNRGLGDFHDDPLLLEIAIHYLNGPVAFETV